jgi:hypothetical protein
MPLVPQYFHGRRENPKRREQMEKILSKYRVLPLNLKLVRAAGGHCDVCNCSLAVNEADTRSRSLSLCWLWWHSLVLHVIPPRTAFICAHLGLDVCVCVPGVQHFHYYFNWNWENRCSAHQRALSLSLCIIVKLISLRKWGFGGAQVRQTFKWTGTPHSTGSFWPRVKVSERRLLPHESLLWFNWMGYFD